MRATTATAPRHRTSAALALLTLLGSGGCLETFVADDVSFDQWCGDSLCNWQVDEGRIEKAATWHRSDSGVRLLGNEAQISQFQDFEDEDCIRFELIADVAAETRTTLQLDFNGDGTVDLSQALPTRPWEREEFIVRAPERYHGVRFILHKAAPGRAVISQMAPSAVNDDACEGAPLALDPQAEGAACVDDDACAEGVCGGGTCSLCAERGDCGEGESCSVDAHCARGACTVDVCSECAGDDDCREGETCARSDYPQSEQRACIAQSDLPERNLGQPCSLDAQCTGDHACAATGDALEARCGRACSGEDDEGCHGDARCVRLLTYFDEDWLAEDAWVCVAQGDCEDAVFGECVTLDGTAIEL